MVFKGGLFMVNFSLIGLCIFGLIIALLALYNMPRDFLTEFEKNCLETIEKRDKELEEEELNRTLRKWLFKK